MARWGQRMGGFPSIEDVNDILARSVCIIKQERLWRRQTDGRMVRHLELSHFWCHSDGMILLVDELNGIAVSILTPDMVSKYEPEANGKRAAAGQQ